MDGPATKCHMSVLNFIVKEKSSKGYWLMLGTPGLLKSTYGALCKSRKVRKILKKFSDKRGLILKRLVDLCQKNKELMKEYCVEKEGITTCHTYKWAKKGC